MNQGRNKLAEVLQLTRDAATENLEIATHFIQEDVRATKAGTALLIQQADSLQTSIAQQTMAVGSLQDGIAMYTSAIKNAGDHKVHRTDALENGMREQQSLFLEFCKSQSQEREILWNRLNAAILKRESAVSAEHRNTGTTFLRCILEFFSPFLLGRF